MINPDDIIVISFSKKKSGWSMGEDTGVRIYHKLTGLEVSCGEYNSRHKNRTRCLETLEKALGVYKDNPFLNPPGSDIIRISDRGPKKLYLGEWIPEDTSPTKEKKVMSNGILVTKAELAKVLTEIAQAVREHSPESLDYLADNLQAEHDKAVKVGTKIPVSTPPPPRLDVSLNDPGNPR